jgi:hypothetical protein
MENLVITHGEETDVFLCPDADTHVPYSDYCRVVEMTTAGRNRALACLQAGLSLEESLAGEYRDEFSMFAEHVNIDSWTDEQRDEGYYGSRNYYQWCR